jgi:hypothetical protein
VEKTQLGPLPLERDCQTLVKIIEKAVSILESNGTPITVTNSKITLRVVSFKPIRRFESGIRCLGPHQQPTEGKLDQCRRFIVCALNCEGAIARPQ